MGLSLDLPFISCITLVKVLSLSSLSFTSYEVRLANKSYKIMQLNNESIVDVKNSHKPKVESYVPFGGIFLDFKPGR